MSQSVGNAGKLIFGTFEVDLDAGELYRSGFRIKIQAQPFKVLAALLEHPGRIVSREELQIRIWGRETVVEFDRSLSAAVNKLREALGDSAENPRFIETLARRGYRFIAPVQKMALANGTAILERPIDFGPAVQAISDATPAPGASREPEIQVARTVLPSIEPRKSAEGLVWIRWFTGILILLLATDTGVRYWTGKNRVQVQPPHITRITSGGNLAPCFQVEEKFAATDTDGVRLFASVLREGRSRLEAISLSDGSTADVPIPDQLVNPVLGEVSPDGSQFVVRSQLSRETEQPLWVVPTMGGSALRVGGVLAHDAAWMPDGRGILYASGNKLLVVELTHADPQLYANLPGPAYWMRWSPDRSVLRFTIVDPPTQKLSLWQISRDDRTPRPVLSEWGKQSSNCCGNWSADGSEYVFQSEQGLETDLWSLGKGGSTPQRLTDGPLKFLEPVAAKSGRRIYFLGSDVRTAMERYSASQHLPSAVPPWLEGAVRVAYSRDGEWVAWTMPDGSLWRSRSNGTERLQLTPTDMEVFLADWSPDDSQLAIMARIRNQAWRIYVVPSAGGHAALVFDDGHNAADPSWGPDGKELVFGRLNDVMGQDSSPRTLQIVDASSGRTETVPGSDGLYSPRWSPDGKYIAALSADGLALKVFATATQRWIPLPVKSGADPRWSRDSRSLYVHEFANPLQPIERISIPDARIEDTLDLVKPQDQSNLAFTFSGVTPAGDLLVRAGTSCSNLYAMDLTGADVR